VISLMGPLSATRQPDRQGDALRQRGPGRGLSGAGRSVYPDAGDGWPGQDGRWRPALPPVLTLPLSSLACLVKPRQALSGPSNPQSKPTRTSGGHGSARTGRCGRRETSVRWPPRRWVLGQASDRLVMAQGLAPQAPGPPAVRDLGGRRQDTPNARRPADVRLARGDQSDGPSGRHAPA
jgi:hypothetical protein